LDFAAVTGGTGAGDTGVPHGSLLIEFAEAVLSPDDRRLSVARKAVVDAMGQAAFVDAAGVAAFFNAIDRVADATGTPLDQETAAATEALREQIGINRFAEIKRSLDR